MVTIKINYKDGKKPMHFEFSRDIRKPDKSATVYALDAIEVNGHSDWSLSSAIQCIAINYPDRLEGFSKITSKDD